MLSDNRIVILGLGLMGGSLALGLRGKCAALYGVDPDPGTLALAMSQNLVDRASQDPAAILPQADVVILAAPIRAIPAILADIPAWHPGEAIVIDLGSTKTGIVAAMAGLPARFDPLGGHPMCGKEKSGLANADPLIFQGARFAFTPLERTSERARSLAEQIARAVGARSLWIDPVTHDRWVAASSHLPHLVAIALALATPGEVSPLIGPGFHSTTRLAHTTAGILMDMLVTNRADVLTALHRYQDYLAVLEKLLSDSDYASLEATLVQAGRHLEALLERSEA
jgi:prephenate dehydrogenase